MKVSVYDEDGELVGVAWHEDTTGYVELPPATRACVATHFSVNDGPLQELTSHVLVPVDGEVRLRIRAPGQKRAAEDYFERALREALGADYKVDRDATLPTWWAIIKRWFR